MQRKRKQTVILETETVPRQIIAAAAEARRASGKSQADIARILGLENQGNVSRFERANDVKLSTLVAYLEALELTVTFT